MDKHIKDQLHVNVNIINLNSTTLAHIMRTCEYYAQWWKGKQNFGISINQNLIKGCPKYFIVDRPDLILRITIKVTKERSILVCGIAAHIRLMAKPDNIGHFTKGLRIVTSLTSSLSIHPCAMCYILSFIPFIPPLRKTHSVLLIMMSPMMT